MASTSDSSYVHTPLGPVSKRFEELMTSVKVNSSIHIFNLCVHGFINHKHMFLQSDWPAYILTKDTKSVESDHILPSTIEQHI